jgi:hypothetical protein
MNHRIYRHHVERALVIVRLLVVLVFGSVILILADPARAVEGQFEQSLTHEVTSSPSDDVTSLQATSALKLFLPGFTFSGSADLLDEIHSAKVSLSHHQQLIGLKLSLDTFNLHSMLERLQISFPKAPEKDKTTLTFESSTSVALEALTVAGDLSLESRNFPNKTLKNELLSGFGLTGSWATDLWKLSISFQNDARGFPNDPKNKSGQQSSQLQTDLDLSLGVWEGAASLSHGVLTFPKDPKRNEYDFDHSLQLAGDLAMLSMACSVALSDVVRPLDPSQEKHSIQLTGELTREFLSWQLGFKVTDEQILFPHDAKKEKTVRKHQFTAERDFEKLALSATLKHEETDLPNDPAKCARFSEGQLRATWPLAQAAFTVTLNAQHTNFPNGPANDVNQEKLDLKLNVNLLADLEATLLSRLARKTFPANALKNELTTMLELSFKLGF